MMQAASVGGAQCLHTEALVTEGLPQQMKEAEPLRVNSILMP